MFGPESIVFGSVILFLVWFFVIIPFVLASVSGWAALAAEYRLNVPFEGKRWWFQDVTLRGWCGYNGCVSVGANADGLYLNTVFWVRHPPLFIPWSDLSVSRREVKFLGFRVGLVEFTTARVPGIRIALKESVLKRIAEAYAGLISASTGTIVPPPSEPTETPG
jgi:hypothetical protein